MASEAKRKANIAYNKRQDAITIRPKRIEGGRIRSAAARHGQSVQGYILETLRARMDADGEPMQEEQTETETE